MGQVLQWGPLQGWEPVGAETRVDNDLAEVGDNLFKFNIYRIYANNLRIFFSGI